MRKYMFKNWTAAIKFSKPFSLKDAMAQIETLDSALCKGHCTGAPPTRSPVKEL